MAKFIRLENKVLNVDLIETIVENFEIIKHREEWFDKDEKEIQGIVIFMTGDHANGIVFKSISIDEILGLLNEVEK